jgi:ABC-2 type transport system permease protein
MTWTMRVLAAETLKAGTLRLTWVLALAAIALALLGVGVTIPAGDAAGLDLSTRDGLYEALSTANLGVVLALVLGIIGMAGEFRQATATDTYLGTPRRGRVIAAKVVVYATLGAAVGALGGLIATGLGVVLLPDGSAAVTGRLLVDVVVGLTLMGALYGALGVAVGGIVPNQVAALVGALVWILGIEAVIGAVAPDVARWLPVGAATALSGGMRTDGLEQGLAALVLAAYAVAAITVAVQLNRRRDIL